MHLYNLQVKKLLLGSRPEPTQRIAYGDSNTHSSSKAKLNWTKEIPKGIVSRRISRMYSMIVFLFCIQTMCNGHVSFLSVGMFDHQSTMLRERTEPQNSLMLSSAVFVSKVIYCNLLTCSYCSILLIYSRKINHHLSQLWLPIKRT